MKDSEVPVVMRAFAATVFVFVAASFGGVAMADAPAPTVQDQGTVQPPTPAPVQNPDPAQGSSPSDTSSKTCQVNVPIWQAIPCEVYPASLQAFCQKYKPMQTDMEHCQRAEQYAQSVPPSGQHKDECMRQTFNMGTSSWSFVLACAKTASNQGGTGDGSKALNKDGINPVGGGGGGGGDSGGGTSPGTTSSPTPANYDSQCYKKLEGMGAKFSPKGQVNYSGPSGTCTVQLSVSYTNRDVSYTTSNIDCNLALLWENFGKKVKGIGVSKVGNFGTVACRTMNNGRTASSNMSKHAYGYAADMDPWVINGQALSGSRYFSDPSARATLQQVVQASCEAFNLTLAFNFYGGRQGIHHVHGQFSQHGCDPSQRH